MESRKILFWTPRILAILLCAYFFLFITHAFAQQFDVGNLLMSLVPGTIILLTLILSWKWENFGILFVVYGLGYLGMALSNGISTASLLIISLPLLLIGILFSVSFFTSKFKKK